MNPLGFDATVPIQDPGDQYSLCRLKDAYQWHVHICVFLYVKFVQFKLVEIPQ